MSIIPDVEIKKAIDRIRTAEKITLSPDDVFRLVIAIREQNIAGKRLARAVESAERYDARDALRTYDRADTMLDEWLLGIAGDDGESHV